MITKEQVDYLSDPDIKKREYDEIIEKISDRTQEIWEYICKKQNRKLEWWAYSNDEEYGNGNGSSGGYFRPEYDDPYIELIGEFGHGYYWNADNYDKLWKKVDYMFESGFPTELLWDTNWKQTIDQHITEEKEAINEGTDATKKTGDARKEKRLQMAKSIASKLTKDELKFIKTQFSAEEKKLLQ